MQMGKAHEKMFDITNQQRNADQEPPHTCQRRLPLEHKLQVLRKGCGEKPPASVSGVNQGHLWTVEVFRKLSRPRYDLAVLSPVIQHQTRGPQNTHAQQLPAVPLPADPKHPNTWTRTRTHSSTTAAHLWARAVENLLPISRWVGRREHEIQMGRDRHKECQCSWVAEWRCHLQKHGWTWRTLY